MVLDFTTISLTGLLAICVIVCAVTIVFSIVFRNVRALKIQTNRISVETSEKTKEFETKYQQTKEDALTSTKGYVKRQSLIASHHVGVIAGDLRDLFSRNCDLTQEEKNMVWVLVSLFVSELHRQLVDNFTENHIGKTDEEIEQYTRMRAREYTSFAKSFFDDYDWTMPRYRLKDALKFLPPDYFFTRLFIVYKDGKSIENE